MTSKNDLINTLQKNAAPIMDEEVISVINSGNASRIDVGRLYDDKLLSSFLQKYKDWLLSNSTLTFTGIRNYKSLRYTHGTAQAFDHFYAKNCKRRFRFFKGDFVYHQLSARNYYSYCYLEDDELRVSDAVVISAPFSDTGNIHPLYDETLSRCCDLNIPVLVDCAYVNLSRGISINLDYRCIETVAFSLSKMFYGTDRLRIGMRMQREDLDDPIDVFNIFQMVNMTGVIIGNELIENFNPRYIVDKYGDIQLEICKGLHLVPSDCVIFGLGDNKYAEFNRGGEANRICLSKSLSTEWGRK